MDRLFFVLLLIAVCAIAVPSYVSGNTSCPDVWVAFNGSCYLFGHGSTTTFTEAEHYCNQHGGHLIHVENGHENAFLKDYMGRLTAGANYWIGLTSELIATEWVWYDTQTLPVYTDWYPHEPNTAGYHCTIAYAPTPYHYKWVDFSCQRKANAICKQSGTMEEIQMVG